MKTEIINLIPGLYDMNPQSDHDRMTGTGINDK